MKTPSKRAVIKTAKQRLTEWQAGFCPYCEKTNIMAGIIDDGRYLGLCFDCKSENFFSGPSVRGRKK
jgi:hypothetical protein